MTRAEIITELRRSAREDARPWRRVADKAYIRAHTYGHGGLECAIFLDHDDCRTFFLLVACALEDEC